MKKTVIFFSIICALVLASFVGSQHYTKIGPKKRFEWQTVHPKDVNLDDNYLTKLINDINDSVIYAVDGIIVVRNGKIAFEKYFNGFTADSLHNVASVGKTITSALTGIALEKGLIPDRKAKMLGYFTDRYEIQHLNSKKSKIEIQHLLTMSSGSDRTFS